jgi:TRAP-type C4-dicarboxylate transport system substrate-binding protein
MEKIKKKQFLWIAGLIGFLTLGIPLTGGSDGQAAQIVLKAAYYAADNHPISKLGRESLAEVEKLTEGRVKIVIYPNQSLLPVTETAAGVDEGTAFCANWYMPYMSKTIPLFDLETQALWTGGIKGVQMAYENGINDLYTEALYRQGLKNTKIAGVSMLLWRVLGMSKDLVKVPDDAKGKKIRSVGAEADMWRNIGASPVNITSPQTYEALSRGIAEGATNALQIMLDRRWVEYVKFVTNINLSPVLMHVIYNTKELKKLDPKDQPIVERAMKKLADDSTKGLIALDEETKSRAMKEFGVKFYDPTPKERVLWIRAAAPIVKQFEAIKDPLIQRALKIAYKYNPKE